MKTVKESSLREEEKERYARHLMLPQIGAEGQERLRDARVLVVGAGGLGSPCLLYLAAAGVGHLGVVDSDAVSRSNLQRQVLYTDADVGAAKVERAAAALQALNPMIEVQAYDQFIQPDQIRALVQQYDVVVDGSDNFLTRYAINDACVLESIPLVAASLTQFEGMLAVFGTSEGPCYRCLFPEPPGPGEAPNCTEAGVLGTVPGVFGVLQANEVIKLITKAGQALTDRVLRLDLLSMHMRTVRLFRDPDCPACGETPLITEVHAIPSVGCMSIDTLSHEVVLANPTLYHLVDVRSTAEFDAGHLPHAISVPLDVIVARKAEIGERGIPVLYCQAGTRARLAAAALKQEGLTEIFLLDVGYAALRGR